MRAIVVYGVSAVALVGLGIGSLFIGGGNSTNTNPAAVADYRAGKAQAVGFLVGQVMKAASGKANPKRVNESLKRALDALETENAK